MRLAHAYNRVWQMTITRLRAEGEKWNLWHRKNRWSGKKSYFPKKYRNRVVIKFDETADYTINQVIMREYHRTAPPPTPTDAPT